ncbi:hypothetical protein K440DRAFT_618092 [Wilcoxina mikolae CBS 423.85]|nr:hypothetical protein K440DRAFT_618092 [Wilcoxina mikolae CBS 423.85]
MEAAFRYPWCKTGNAGKNAPQPPKQQQKKQSPPQQKQPPQQQKKKKTAADFRLPATLRDGGLQKRQLIVENAPRQCRGSSAPQLEGNAKYADPKSFFRFSERELGAKYSPEQLAVAKDKLSTSLSAVGERERERKSDDPPPVQYDDEFLQFAGLTREEVAPPAPDLFEKEAKKCGLDKFSDVKKRQEMPAPQKKAPVPYPNYGIPGPHPYYRGPPPPPALYPPGFYPPPPPPRPYPPPKPEAPRPPPPPPCHPNCPVPCKNHCPEPEVEGKLDVDIAADGSETLVMLIEDIRRYIIFYEAKNIEDIILSAEGDVDLDIPVAKGGVSPGLVFDPEAGVAPWPCHSGFDIDTGLSLAELEFALSQPGQDGPCAESAELAAVKAKEVTETEKAEKPLTLAEAYLKRKEFDDNLNKLGPWCPIGDDQVLKVLEAMV